MFELSKFLVCLLLSELCVFDYLPILELACSCFHRNIRLPCTVYKKGRQRANFGNPVPGLNLSI